MITYDSTENMAGTKVAVVSNSPLCSHYFNLPMLEGVLTGKTHPKGWWQVEGKADGAGFKQWVHPVDLRKVSDPEPDEEAESW